MNTLRHCFREPIDEINQAASYLDKAVSHHLEGNNLEAARLIALADMPVIREWTESIWGKSSPYIRYVPQVTSSLKAERIEVRMPNSAEKKALHQRDGYHCRFCGIPVIRKETRQKIQVAYPSVIGWSQKNLDCHAAFQAMWAQYDHILPHSKGGSNDLDNLVITCAPCNFGRMSYTLEEVALSDPRERAPVASDWDGLERFG